MLLFPTPTMPSLIHPSNSFLHRAPCSSFPFSPPLFLTPPHIGPSSCLPSSIFYALIATYTVCLYTVEYTCAFEIEVAPGNSTLHMSASAAVSNYYVMGYGNIKLFCDGIVH